MPAGRSCSSNWRQFTLTGSDDMIDALGLAENLEQAGFPREQTQDLAAKSDLRELELRLDARLGPIGQKIADAQTAMIKWFSGVMIAQAAAIVALIKLLPGG
jgi:hypothetical protein